MRTLISSDRLVRFRRVAAPAAVFFALSVLIGFSAASQASPLPNAQFSGQAVVNVANCEGCAFNTVAQDSGFSAGTYTASDGVALVNSTLTGAVDPTISSSVSNGCTTPCAILGGVTIDGYSDSRLIYAVQVTGPAGGPVPVIFASSGLVSASSDPLCGNTAGLTPCSSADSRLMITDPDDNTIVNLHATVFGSTSFNATQTLMLDVGATYLVDLHTFAEAFNGWAASASIDPLFTIDPSFGDAGSYGLQFSANLIPPAVPEPASLALLGLGVAWLGVRRRQQRWIRQIRT